MRLRFTRLSEAAVAPVRAHGDDAGLDLHAAEGASLAPGERASVGTGVAVAIPQAAPGSCCRARGWPRATGSPLVNARASSTPATGASCGCCC